MDTPDFTTTTAATTTTTIQPPDIVPPPLPPTTANTNHFFRENSVKMNTDSTSRDWTTVTCNVEGFDMNIQMKSRLTDYQTTIDESLYQPIVYQFFHSSSSSSSLLKQAKGIIMLKAQVLKFCSEKQEYIPVKHHQHSEQSVISGQTEMNFQTSGDVLSAVQKIQFTDSSFHHDRKGFVLQFSYFAPLMNEKEPILVKQSAEFRVFARKPQVLNGSTTGKNNNNRSTSPSTTDGQVEFANLKRTGQKRKLEQFQEEKRDQETESPNQPIPPVESDHQYRMHLERQGQQDGFAGSAASNTVTTTKDTSSPPVVVTSSPTEEHSLPFKFRKTVKQSLVQSSSTNDSPTSSSTSSPPSTSSTHKIQNMVEFKETLQDLLEYHEHLETNTKRVLMDIVVRSVLKLDPQYSKQLLVKYLSSALGTSTEVSNSVPHSNTALVNNSIK